MPATRTEADAQSIEEQSERLEHLMPAILRRLFTLRQAGALANLPMAQLRICSYLEEGPNSMSAIADELGISTSAITQIADRMERGGLVERELDRSDRRLKHLHLTPHAEQLMEARRTERTRRLSQALLQMAPETRASLLAGLEELFEAASITAPNDHEALGSVSAPN